MTTVISRLPRQIALLAALVVLALALGAAGARAATYCAAKPSCVAAGGVNAGSAATGATIENAINLAASNPGPDRVELGAATFSVGSSRTAAAGNQIDFVGAGRDATTLDLGAAGVALEALDPGSSISDVGVRLLGNFGRGFTSAGLIERVRVVSSPSTNASGVQLNDGGTLRSAVIELDPSDLDTGIHLAGANTTVSDTTIRAGYGLFTDRPGGVARRVRLRGIQPVRVHGGGDLTIDQALIEPAAATGVPSLAPTGLRAVAPCCGASTSSIYARHVTIVGDNSTGSIGAQAASDFAATGQNTNIVLEDSIVTGVANSIRREGVARARERQTSSRASRTSTPPRSSRAARAATTRGPTTSTSIRAS